MPEQQGPVAVTGRTDAEILTLTAETRSRICTVQYLPDLMAQKWRGRAGGPGRDVAALAHGHRVRAPSSAQVQSESLHFLSFAGEFNKFDFLKSKHAI